MNVTYSVFIKIVSRLLDAWKMPLRPFTWFMWIVLFFTFIYESITLMTAQGFISDKVFLSTFGMMLSQSLPNVGTTWRIRSVTGWVLITGLIIDNAYGSGLASVYTVPEYEKTIDTAQDIVDGNIEWGASNEAWIYSLTSSTEPLVKQLLRQFRVFPPEVLTRKSLNRSIALSIERLSSGNARRLLDEVGASQFREISF
ncbi:unnamed protein product [Diatraea saccharalis]|uniref:Uncharacterized protein n=1 Tax=Diatraea saccharalis TaxID=40085 RepID=A0A9N9R8Q7_9NEOP|nr:unnamed protein product [Diatraea saccharalis]